ncbi:MAG: DsbA family protein [Pseudomonadota bacterium]
MSIYRIFFALCLGLMTAGASAQQTLSPEEEAMVKRITDAVIKRLQDSDVLQQQIDAGIESYIARQRQQQAQAREREAERRMELAKQNLVRPSEKDHRVGAADAPITLVEYSDFECPYCKRFHQVAIQLLADMPAQINWVYRHFPLEFHNPGAQKQAEAAECAAMLGGNDAFWKYTDTIYERTRSGGKGFPVAALHPLAVELGLDAEAFEECLGSDKMAKVVQRQYEEGIKAGIRGTPGNIMINNVTGDIEVFAGAASLEQLKAAATRLLAKGGDTKSGG